MALDPMTLESLERWAESEKTRQERLFAASIAEESLQLLILEEEMKRERLEQRLRHEHALIELSMAALKPMQSPRANLDRGEPLCHLVEEFDTDALLPLDSIDQLTEEEVEHFWHKEKQKLQLKIGKLNDRIRKLCR